MSEFQSKNSPYRFVVNGYDFNRYCLTRFGVSTFVNRAVRTLHD
jgi:hypothetical protein